MKDNVFVLGCLMVLPLFAGAQPQGTAYDPIFWVEGVVNSRNAPDEAALKKMIDDVHAQGWQGVMY